jgi:hypothetical protein
MIIETPFRAVGAIRGYEFRGSNGENVLHLRGKNGFYISFLPIYYPDGVNHKDVGTR